MSHRRLLLNGCNKSYNAIVIVTVHIAEVFGCQFWNKAIVL